MQYLLLIYRNEAELSKMTPADRQAMSAEYGTYTQSIVQSGHFKAGDGLQPTTTATTVRVREGKTLRPTVRSRRPASNSAATIWSRPRISTPPLGWLRGFREPGTDRSRSGRS